MIMMMIFWKGKYVNGRAFVWSYLARNDNAKFQDSVYSYKNLTCVFFFNKQFTIIKSFRWTKLFMLMLMMEDMILITPVYW